MSEANSDDSEFDKILEKCVNVGYFHKRFIWIYNFVLAICIGMVYMSKFVSLNVPDHWCLVPGRETSNYTLEQWKQLTIPLKNDSPDNQSYSKCIRFANGVAINTFNTNKTIKCDQGWEYDKTWYDLTTPMQHDWVCDNEMIPINIQALILAAEMISSLVFGQLADNFGRMPMFFVVVVTLSTTRIVSLYTSSWVYLFMFLTFLNSQCTTAYQIPLIIPTEISRIDKRAFVTMLVMYGFAFGCIIAPVCMWWLRDWVSFSLLTTLPCLLFFFSRQWMIESPRWLLSRGRVNKCIAQFKKIFKTNRQQIPSNLEEKLLIITCKQENSSRQTICGIFSSWRLAKNAITIVYCYSVTLFISISFILSISNLDGNPFMNYTFQILAELPAYIIGQYVCDRYGRRVVTFTGFVITSIGLFLVVFVIQDPLNFQIVNVLCIILRTVIMLTFYSTFLQSNEMYPTCIRQTGAALAMFFGNAFSILSPYVVALGMTVHVSFPYIIYTICTLIAAVCSLFLPETMGQKLPDTYKDAAVFGADQDFFGRRKLTRRDDKEVEVPLNQNKE